MDIKSVMQEALVKLDKKTESNQSSPLLPESSKLTPPKLTKSDIQIIMAQRYDIPPLFLNSDFTGTLSLDLTESGVCLTGNPGTGKTMALALLVRDWLKLKSSLRECDVKNSWFFISYPEFIMDLQDSFRHETGPSANEMLREVAGVKRLIVDDLGAEKPTDYVRQATYFLINHREMYRLPTFITTNFSMDFLDKNLDPRISSRIAGMCEIVRLEGPDRRIRLERRRHDENHG